MQMMVKEILHQWNYTESPKNENLPLVGARSQIQNMKLQPKNICMHLHNVNCYVFSVENGTTFSQINWAFRSETDLSHPSKELEGEIGSEALHSWLRQLLSNRCNFKWNRENRILVATVKKKYNFSTFILRYTSFLCHCLFISTVWFRSCAWTPLFAFYLSLVWRQSNNKTALLRNVALGSLTGYLIPCSVTFPSLPREEIWWCLCWSSSETMALESRSLWWSVGIR